MAPLADLPLNYMPDAVPLLLIEKPGHPVSPTDGIKLADGAVSLDPHADSLTLVMRCAAHTDAPQPPPNLLPEHTKANAALALSQTGLDRILGRLCTLRLRLAHRPPAPPRTASQFNPDGDKDTTPRGGDGSASQACHSRPQGHRHTRTTRKGRSLRNVLPRRKSRIKGVPPQTRLNYTRRGGTAQRGDRRRPGDWSRCSRRHYGVSRLPKLLGPKCAY